MMLEQDIFTIALFGLITNLFFSIMFGVLINQNVGIIEVMKIVKGRKQPWYLAFSFLVPFAKAIITLYRVYILQVYFLNRGKSYQEFLAYIVK
jgi:uncharacterized membrane protein